MPSLDPVDAVVTDPPYLYLKHKLDRPFDHNDWIEKVRAVTKPDACLSFFGRGVAMAEWTVAAANNKFDFKEEIVWNKTRISSPFLALGRTHEMCFIFGKGKFKINKVFVDYVQEAVSTNSLTALLNTLRRINSELRKIKSIEDLKKLLENNYLTEHNFKHALIGHKYRDKNKGAQCLQMLSRGALLKSIITEGTEHYKYKHPTQKPVALMSKIIKLCSAKNQTVLDTFMGGGSTLVACVAEGRRGVGVEIDEEYFNVACERVEQAYKTNEA